MKLFKRKKPQVLYVPPHRLPTQHEMLEAVCDTGEELLDKETKEKFMRRLNERLEKIMIVEGE